MDLARVEQSALMDRSFRPVAAAMRILAPCFILPWELWAQPYGEKGGSSLFKLLFKNVAQDGARSTPAMVVKVDAEVIEIPNVYLPDHLRHQALMYRALEQVVLTAEKDGQRVVVSECVNRYRRSLLARGAVQTPNISDAVVLHPEMDFGPSRMSVQPTA
ncbi:hypothetical protein ABQZ99_013675 [Xanthomonas hortorum pv. vitians]|uniref:hypothetical protein n=1 Tax=Xanthomonas TaxID=338 RepID=UPI002B222A61|nr:hypothetical protein [Xanthomonas campestris]MEA9920785.1 hypothetical protein [Xanthomonas campestris pv. raphani]